LVFHHFGGLSSAAQLLGSDRRSRLDEVELVARLSLSYDEVTFLELFFRERITDLLPFVGIHRLKDLNLL